MRKGGYRKQFIIYNQVEDIENFYNRKEWYIHPTDFIFKQNLFCSKEYFDNQISHKFVNF